MGYLLQGYLGYLGLTQGLKKEIGGAIAQSVERNPWFTDFSVRQSLSAIARDMLSPKQMQEWLSRYVISENTSPQNVGIIMAGNIPLVGFHDLLCVLVSGNRAVVKLSSKDDVLLFMVVKLLCQIDHRFVQRIEFVGKLEGNVDAVIATGSDNSARYFEFQFGNLPHVFRKNRTSVAVLSGSEGEEDLQMLGRDVFDYFGLGCRSVSKIFLPKGFDISLLQKAFSSFEKVREHAAYNDCVRYATAMHQMRKTNFYDLDACVATYNDELHSPVGELFLQEYSAIEEVGELLTFYKDNLQCIATNTPLAGLESSCVPLGKTQRPRLWDYADGVDTMKFLLALS